METPLPDALPSTFTYGQARELGIPRRAIESLAELGRIERVAHGLYRRADGDLGDLDLLAAAARSPSATLCLTSALARHDLTDDIPFTHDLAIPRGTRAPALPGPITWHRFAAETFWLGRDQAPLGDGMSIGLYSPERTIVDAFRMRRELGPEPANEALKRWLRRKGSHPAALLAIAQHFPRAAGPLRQTLQVLL